MSTDYFLESYYNEKLKTSLRNLVSSIFPESFVYLDYDKHQSLPSGMYLRGQNYTKIRVRDTYSGKLTIEIIKVKRNQSIAGTAAFDINSPTLKRDVIEHCARFKATPLTQAEMDKIAEENAKKKDEDEYDDDYWFPF
jgi:hypothetical protein